MNTEFVICDTIEDVTQKSSDLIQELCLAAIRNSGSASLAVSGGSTPQALFKLWQTETFPHLDSVKVFMSDERIVPITSVDSNSGTMLRLWPDVVNAQLYLPKVDNLTDDVASQYQHTLVGALGDAPQFDCVMLGLGEDGHTASLFPGKPSLVDENLVCMADHGELPPPVKRLTLTYKCINGAANVVVIATGVKKRRWIEAFRNGVIDKDVFPLSGVQPVGKLWFVVDRTAWPEA